MANESNKWDAPSLPPPMFLGEPERDLVKQVNDELIENVIGQQIIYYPIDIAHTNYHKLYGEAIVKNFLSPIHVYVLVEWEGETTNQDVYGIDRRASLTLHFHRRRLVEDQDLRVSVGDFVLYGEDYYEIVELNRPKELFGQVNHKMEISAKCIRAREGTFNAT